MSRWHCKYSANFFRWLVHPQTFHVWGVVLEPTPTDTVRQLFVYIFIHVLVCTLIKSCCSINFPSVALTFPREMQTNVYSSQIGHQGQNKVQLGLSVSSFWQSPIHFFLFLFFFFLTNPLYKFVLNVSFYNEMMKICPFVSSSSLPPKFSLSSCLSFLSLCISCLPSPFLLLSLVLYDAEYKPQCFLAYWTSHFLFLASFCHLVSGPSHVDTLFFLTARYLWDGCAVF